MLRATSLPPVPGLFLDLKSIERFHCIGAVFVGVGFAVGALTGFAACAGFAACGVGFATGVTGFEACGVGFAACGVGFAFGVAFVFVVVSGFIN